MTELLVSGRSSSERRSCHVTGQHLRLAMLAAGVEEQHTSVVAERAGVFETDITQAFPSLMQAGLITFDRNFRDQLTPEGQQYAAAEITPMLAAHDIVASLEV